MVKRLVLGFVGLFITLGLSLGVAGTASASESFLHRGSITFSKKSTGIKYLPVCRELANINNCNYYKGTAAIKQGQNTKKVLKWKDTDAFWLPKGYRAIVGTGANAGGRYKAVKKGKWVKVRGFAGMKTVVIVKRI